MVISKTELYLIAFAAFLIYASIDVVIQIGWMRGASAETDTESAKQHTLGPKVAKALKAAQKLAEQQKFEEALAKVKETEAIAGKTPYEEHTINHFSGYVHANLKDYAAAAGFMKKAIDSGFFPPEQLKEQLKIVSMLNYELRNYSGTAAYARRYLEAIAPAVDDNITLLLAQSYYLQSDFKNAVSAIQPLIRRTEQADGAVNEQWLILEMSGQYKLGDKKGVIATLEKLATRFPSPEYWRDLLGNMQEQQGLSDAQLLDIYRLKLAVNALEGGDEYIEMAELALQIGLPGDAQRVLESGFAAGILKTDTNQNREARLLKEARVQAAADRQSLPSLESEVRTGNNGEADAKLGEAYASHGQHDKAIEALTRSLTRKGLKYPDQARLALGLAYLNTHRQAEAVKIFNTIAADSLSARLARLWLTVSP